MFGPLTYSGQLNDMEKLVCFCGSLVLRDLSCFSFFSISLLSLCKELSLFGCYSLGLATEWPHMEQTWANTFVRTQMQSFPQTEAKTIQPLTPFQLFLKQITDSWIIKRERKLLIFLSQLLSYRQACYTAIANLQNQCCHLPIVCGDMTPWIIMSDNLPITLANLIV